jgi:hypothetical protein
VGGAKIFRIPFCTRLVGFAFGGLEGGAKVDTGLFGMDATWDRCKANLRGLMVALCGLENDFFEVKTALRARRIGVGLPSSEVREGGAASEPLSEGV